MKSGILIALSLLVLVAVGHLLRLAFGIELVIAETRIPMWMSVVAVAVFGIAAFLLWRESQRAE